MANVTRTPPLVPTIKTAFVNPSSIGQTAVVAAAPGMSIRVIDAAIVSTAANSVKFQSASTDISATWPLGANGGLSLSFNEHGWFQTNPGEALNINMTAATATGVHVNYIIL